MFKGWDKLSFPGTLLSEFDFLVDKLEYWAAFSVLGSHCKGAPMPDEGPDLSTFFRSSGREHDLAVRQDGVKLLPRFAVIAMISEAERKFRNLLILRRLIETLDKSTPSMPPGEFWDLTVKTQTSIRGIVHCCQLLVMNPSHELSSMISWLDGANRIRNCLIHHGGEVLVQDVKKPKTEVKDVHETDRLEVCWLTPQYANEQGPISSFEGYVHPGGRIGIRFVEERRSWGLGDFIEIDALDCQCISFSIQKLSGLLLFELIEELKVVLISKGIIADPDSSSIAVPDSSNQPPS